MASFGSAPAAFSFGTAPAPTAGGFSFGAAGTGTAAAPASSFSFGAAGTGTAAAPASGFSFGGGAAGTTAPAPAATGFSFGGGAMGTPAPAPAATSSFSFGGLGAGTPAPAAAATGFSFGGTAASPAPAAASTGFGFGGTTASLAPAAASTGFGFGGAASTSTAPAPATSGFGFGGSGFGANAAATTSGLGGGLFGSNAATSNVASVVQHDTTFEKLPDSAIKKHITDIYGLIKKQHEAADIINRADNDGLLQKLQSSLNGLNQLILKVEALQQAQTVASQNLKMEVKHASRNAEQYGVWSMNQLMHPPAMRMIEELPSKMMWETLHSFEKQLHQHLTSINEIEQQLLQRQYLQANGPDTAGGPYGIRNRISAELLAQILHAQNEAFLRVAGLVAVVHEKMDNSRSRYKATYREDPFTAQDRLEAENEKRQAAKLRDSVARITATSLPATQGMTAAPGANPFGATAAPAAGLFGAGAPSGLFGAASTQAAGGTGVFGSLAPTPATGGIFGAQSPSKPTFGTGGIFGAPAPAAVSAFGAGSTFGAAPGSAFGAAPAPTTSLFGGMGASAFGSGTQASGASSGKNSRKKSGGARSK